MIKKLISLMYHRVGKEKHANSLELLKEHLLYIQKNYPVILPGETFDKTSVLLTFDDATFDFYHYLFPLLKELQLRVLLGVPVGYILEKTDLSPRERLNVPYPLMMQEGVFEKKAPFCTWQELQEMVESGLIEVASHSFSHGNLTFSFMNLEKELVESKRLLEEKLPQAVSSFIYPFGKTNPRVEEAVFKHYTYAFRIGSAFNYSWGNSKKTLSRIPADNLKFAEAPFTLSNQLRYLVNSFK